MPFSRRFLADDNDTTCPFANEPVMPVRLLGLEEGADSHQSEPCTRPENALCGDIQIQVRKLSGDKDKLEAGYVTVGIEGELEFGRCATRAISPSLSYEHESYIVQFACACMWLPHTYSCNCAHNAAAVLVALSHGHKPSWS